MKHTYYINSFRLKGTALLALAALLVACVSPNSQERQILEVPSYATQSAAPASLGSSTPEVFGDLFLRVECPKIGENTEIYVSNESREVFYNEDGSQKTKEAFCEERKDLKGREVIEQ